MDHREGDKIDLIVIPDFVLATRQRKVIENSIFDLLT
jgi:hypothetical protein